MDKKLRNSREEAIIPRWLRRWRERDDRSLVKRSAPEQDLDPIEELARVVGEAQERDAEDERRLDRMLGERPFRIESGKLGKSASGCESRPSLTTCRDSRWSTSDSLGGPL